MRIHTIAKRQLSRYGLIQVKNQFIIRVMGNCTWSISILCFIMLIMMDVLNSFPQPHPMLPIVNGEIVYSGNDAMEASEKNEMNNVDK